MKQPLAAQREEYARLLESTLRTVVEKLSQLPEVRRISVFGSYANGHADLFTDLDLLVVMDTTSGPIDRLRRLYGLLASPVDLDIICYTPQEFEREKDAGFLRRVLAQERLLYEKDTP